MHFNIVALFSVLFAFVLLRCILLLFGAFNVYVEHFEQPRVELCYTNKLAFISIYCTYVHSWGTKMTLIMHLWAVCEAFTIIRVVKLKDTHNNQSKVKIPTMEKS